VQFFAEGGIYSFPALGTPYLRATRTNSAFFGPLPVGYLKLAPSDTFSIQGGKLPTLIGAEYAFTFQNINIERGLLWNQEPIISQGVQVNYTLGPLALSGSFNDGFYSDRFNWVVGAATYTIDSSQTVELVGGGNVGTSSTATLATPLPQNNGQIANLIYTFNAAPWTVTGYMQYSHVPKVVKLGLGQDVSSAGGAVLASYAFDDNFSLGGRAEVLGTTGELIKGAPNLLYGPGSAAFSFTVTPTWQWGRFFVRGEGALVVADGTTAGFVFGHSGNAETQGRFLLETGFIF